MRQTPARDESVILAARREEEWAQEEVVRLIRCFARHICSTGGGRVAPELDWEDVAQEACRAFFGSAMHRYQEGNDQSYLYTIVRITRLRFARLVYRRLQREEESEGAWSSPDNDPQARLNVDLILRRLDHACRELLEQIFLCGTSYPELAGELGLAESSVRSRVARCVRRAREMVSPEFP